MIFAIELRDILLMLELMYTRSRKTLISKQMHMSGSQKPIMLQAINNVRGEEYTSYDGPRYPLHMMQSSRFSMLPVDLSVSGS